MKKNDSNPKRSSHGIRTARQPKVSDPVERLKQMKRASDLIDDEAALLEGILECDHDFFREEEQ